MCERCSTCTFTVSASPYVLLNGAQPPTASNETVASLAVWASQSKAVVVPAGEHRAARMSSVEWSLPTFREKYFLRILKEFPSRLACRMARRGCRREGFSPSKLTIVTVAYM